MPETHGVTRAIVRGFQATTSVSTGGRTTITSTGAITIVADNDNRKSVLIQNLSTSELYIAYGFTPSTTKHSLILKGGSAANDGKGAALSETLFVGAIKGYASTGDTVIVSHVEVS